MLSLEGCHPPGLLEAWVFPESHSEAHSSEVAGARCVCTVLREPLQAEGMAEGESCSQNKAHAVSSDKWCLTACWPHAHPPDLWNVLCLDCTHSQPGPDLERAEAPLLALGLCPCHKKESIWKTGFYPRSCPSFQRLSAYLQMLFFFPFPLLLMVSSLFGLCSECKAEDKVFKNLCESLVAAQQPILRLQV